MDLPPELRRTSDSLLEAIDRIRDLEREKRTLVPGSPEFLRIASEVEDLSRNVLRDSEREEHLGQQVAELRSRGLEQVAGRPIDEVSPPRPSDVVFEEWSAAEQRLIELDPDSPEAEEARAEARRLRDEWAASSRIRSEE